MDTPETDTSAGSRGTPHWGHIPLHILKTCVFIEDTLLLQNSWGLPWQDSFAETWIYIQRLIFLKSKIVILFSSRSCFFQLAPSFSQRWKIFPLKALQWELKTLSREDECCWYTRQYWREQYLLKGITNISPIHMQTAVQETKQCGERSTACFFPFCTCWWAVAGSLHHIPGIQSCKNLLQLPRT